MAAVVAVIGEAGVVMDEHSQLKVQVTSITNMVSCNLIKAMFPVVKSDKLSCVVFILGAQKGDHPFVAAIREIDTSCSLSVHARCERIDQLRNKIGSTNCEELRPIGTVMVTLLLRIVSHSFTHGIPERFVVCCTACIYLLFTYVVRVCNMNYKYSSFSSFDSQFHLIHDISHAISQYNR